MCSVGVQLLISEPTLQDGVEAEEGEITYCVTSRCASEHTRLCVTGFVRHIII